MSSASSSIPSALIIIVAIALIAYRRQRRQVMRVKHNLKKNQRTVNLYQQWLDPVVELIIVGGVLATDLRHGWLPWLSLVIGIAIGAPLGVLRGRFMYVKSVSGHKLVVERNVAEISILFILILIKLEAEHLSHDPTSALNLIASGLLAVGVTSSIGRMVYITVQHNRSQQTSGGPSQNDKKA